MPGLSASELEAIREEAFAEDLEITPEMAQWSRADAVQYFESGGTSVPGAPPPPPPPPPPCLYEVLNPYVNVRDSPNLMGRILGKKMRNDRVEAEGCGGPDNAWILLKERFADEKHLQGSKGWLLTDGHKAGMAQMPVLLKHVSGPLPPVLGSDGSAARKPTTAALAPAATSSSSASASRVALAAPMTFEVVNSFVRVRTAPTADAPEHCTMKRKGTLVSVSARQGDWVQIEPEPQLLPTGSGEAGSSGGEAGGGGWMLTDGKSMSPPLGALMRPHIVRTAEGAKWVVTRKGACTGYPSPGGVALGEPGTRLSYCCEGELVDIVAECGLWVEVQPPDGGTTSWIEIDVFLAG